MTRVDESQAAGLWAWVMRKAGLVEPDGQVLGAARKCLGFHAARPYSPIVAACARTTSGTDLTSCCGPEKTPELTLVRSVRGTLFYMTREHTHVALQATRKQRIRDATYLVHRARVTSSVESTIRHQVAGMSSRSFVLRDSVIAELQADGSDAAHVRAVMRLMWEEGGLVHRDVSGTWARRTMAVRYMGKPPAPDPNDEQLAQEQLILLYLATYGPASRADIAWWTGLPSGILRHALGQASLVEIPSKWTKSYLLMLEEDWQAYLDDGPPQPPDLQLLGHEDPTLKAYKETRGRFASGKWSARILNQAGEILPTVLSGGQVVGTWHLNRDSSVCVHKDHDVRPALASRLREASTDLQGRVRPFATANS